MNTKTLVVGQDVYMVSGVYGNNGKVVELTSSGVIVQVLAQGPINEPTLMRFDVNGKACDSSDIYNGNMGWVPGTHECGPWELDDTCPDELAALIARRAKENKLIEVKKETLSYLAEWRAK